MRQNSLGVFTIVYCVAYLLLLATDLPLFRYYPVHNEMSFGPHALSGKGPAMAWYGILVGAALPAALGALIVRISHPGRMFGRLVWGIPVFSMTICVVLMRQFFW